MMLSPFFPFDNENEESFRLRISKIQSACLDYKRLEKGLSKWIKKLTWGSFKGQVDHLTSRYYDFSLSHPPLFYSNRRMPLWNVAVTWICHLENGLTIPIIQLRKKRGLIGKCYAFSEVLTHEAFHAFRAGFHQPKYEEILAYRSSGNRLRRYFGPIFEGTWESSFLMVGFFISLLLSISLSLKGGIITGVTLILFFLTRLIYRQRIFRKAEKKLRPFLKAEIPPLWVLARLTDREIEFIAKKRKSKIKTYFLSEKIKNLRIRSILLKYFLLTECFSSDNVSK